MKLFKAGTIQQIVYCACCLIWTNCDWIIVPLGVLFGQTMRKHIYELVVC